MNVYYTTELEGICQKATVIAVANNRVHARKLMTSLAKADGMPVEDQLPGGANELKLESIKMLDTREVGAIVVDDGDV